MALPRPRRPRGPMSAAQKIALKKAQEASARARRGTGKVELKKKPRKAAAAEKPGSRFLRSSAEERKDSITNRKITKAMERNYVRTGSNRITEKDLKRPTPAQRAARVRKAAGLPAKSAGIKEQEKAILDMHAERVRKLDEKYWGGTSKMTERQYNAEVKKMRDEARAKLDALKPRKTAASDKMKPDKPSSTTGSRKASAARDADFKLLDLADRVSGIASKNFRTDVNKDGQVVLVAKTGTSIDRKLDEADKISSRLGKNYQVDFDDNDNIVITPMFGGGARPKGDSSASPKPDKPSSTTGSDTVKAKNGDTVKVGDAVNIGTGGQVWRITGIDGDTVTAKGLLQLNANSKVERKFKASQISGRRDEDRFKEDPRATNANRQAELAKKAGMTVAEYKKKLANDSRKMTKTMKEQNQGNSGQRRPSNLRQTPGGSKPSDRPVGQRPDPGTMGVSQILKERKELIAKQKSEGLTPEENKRLVAVKAESALRHQNRKAGKGTGPTKVGLAKPSDTPKNQPPKASDGSKPAPDQPRDSERKMYVERMKERTDRELKSAVSYATGWKKEELQKEIDRRSSNPKKYGVTRSSLGKDSPKNDNLGSKLNTPRVSKPDAPKASEAVIPKTRNGREVNDNTDLTDLPDKDFNKIDDIRMEMSDVAEETLQRINLVEEIDNAETVGDMMDAMQGLYLYLDEWDEYGRNTSAIRKKLDPMFEDLKRYSDRWPRR